MRRPFVTLDVFTSRRFAGNPLAIVLESAGLETSAMQAIAWEFNLPETVFVFPAADHAHTAKLRIFTPANELPFAGHPTIGAAVWLGRAGAAELVLEENIGPVRCHVEMIDAATGQARFALPRLPSPAQDVPSDEKIALALGLSATDIGCGDFRPCRWSAGIEFTFVPVRDLAAIGHARPNGEHFDSILGAGGPGRAYLFCQETMEAGHDFHARMFAPGMGIPEDPATGSAVAALAGIVAQRMDGEHDLRIEQGYEMGRPSLITLSLTIRQSAIIAAAIGGEAVLVSEGTIEA